MIENPNKKAEPNPVLGCFGLIMFMVSISLLFHNVLIDPVIDYFSTNTESSTVSVEDEFKSQIASDIKNNWSKKMDKECKEVILIKESNTIYSGYANFVGGTQIKIKVTVDVDGKQYIYQPVLF